MKFLSYLSKSYYRNLIEKYLYQFRNLITGKILDIGSKNRRYDHLFNGDITAIDIIPNPELNIIKGDLTSLAFPSNSFDSIICLEVFEYLEPNNFNKGFEEIFRILNQNGNAIISIPFFYWQHKDNMRVTYKYLQNYFLRFPNLEFKIIRVGNKYTALYDVIRSSKNIAVSVKLKNFNAKLLLFFLYIIIKLFSLEYKQDLFYSGLLIIWHKK